VGLIVVEFNLWSFIQVYVPRTPGQSDLGWNKCFLFLSSKVVGQHNPSSGTEPICLMLTLCTCRATHKNRNCPIHPNSGFSANFWSQN